MDGALVKPEETDTSFKLDGAPNAQRVGGVVYPHGVAQVVKHGTQTLAGARRVAADLGLPTDGQLLFADRQQEVIAMQPGSAELPALQMPLLMSRHMGAVGEDFAYYDTKQKLAGSMFEALQTAVKNQTSVRESIADVLLHKHGLHSGHFFEFLPHEWHEALSPIGIVHFYRQLYFNTVEGYGPVEDAFTIAPLETFEVVLENVRRQIHEEQPGNRQPHNRQVPRGHARAAIRLCPFRDRTRGSANIGKQIRAANPASERLGYSADGGQQDYRSPPRYPAISGTAHELSEFRAPCAPLQDPASTGTAVARRFGYPRSYWAEPFSHACIFGPG
jgi:hypothetical protein